MGTKVITLTRHQDDNDFTFSPSPAKVKRTRQVKWQSASGPFQIVFKTWTPLNVVTINSMPGGIGHQTEPATVSASANLGSYHYTAGFGGDNPATIPGCPELIVEP